MDLAGPFTMTSKGHVYVLMLVDVMMRYMWLRPLRTKTAAEVVAAALFGIFA